MQGVNYESGATPPEYVCCKCGATNCKLWREYCTVRPDLFCASCAALSEGVDISTLDERGQRVGELWPRTNQIGGLVPAIPDEEGFGYWGVISVSKPPEADQWWETLPSLPATGD